MKKSLMTATFCMMAASVFASVNRNVEDRSVQKAAFPGKNLIAGNSRTSPSLIKIVFGAYVPGGPQVETEFYESESTFTRSRGSNLDSTPRRSRGSNLDSTPRRSRSINLDSSSPQIRKLELDSKSR